MKKIIFITIALIILIGNIHSDPIPAHWSFYDFNGDVCDVQFLKSPNDKIGFGIIFQQGYYVLLKTTDRGYSWTQITSIQRTFASTNGKPASIYFLNENLGFISCNDGIYKYSVVYHNL